MLHVMSASGFGSLKEGLSTTTTKKKSNNTSHQKVIRKVMRGHGELFEIKVGEYPQHFMSITY